MNNLNARGAALSRAAEAMLRALGGTEVTLRCPTAAAKDQHSRQLGLEAPVTTDINVSPVVVHASGADVEVRSGPASVAQYIQDRGQTAEQFFTTILAVLYGGRELHVKSFSTSDFAGSTYLYRIQLTAKS